MAEPVGIPRLTAVFDTSALIFLGTLDYLSVLPYLYDGRYTPEVARELLTKPATGGDEALSVLTQGHPSDANLQRVMQGLNAGAGEVSSIALALDLGCLVVLDDRLARRYAQQHVPVIGTLGVLLRLHAQGFRKRPLEAELDVLLSVGMRLSPAVIKEFLANP